MRCLLDMDGVIVNFVAGALCLHRISDDPYLLPENRGKWQLEELVGMDKESFFGPMDCEFWENLEPTPEAEEIIKLVTDAFGPDDVCLLTSPGMNDGCPAGKLRWVNKHFPQFARKFLIGPAKHFVAGPSKVLIDDNNANIEVWIRHGGRAVLVPRPWNALAGVDTMKYLREMIGGRQW